MKENLSAPSHSARIRPALLTAMVSAVLVISGCSDSSDPATVNPSVPVFPNTQTGPTVDIQGDVPGSDFFNSGNNSARLSGPVVGGGSIANSETRSYLDFSVVTVNSEIVVDYAYSTRRRDTLSTIIFAIRNAGSQTRCGISLEVAEMNDASGQPVAGSLLFSDPFAQASIAEYSTSMVYTDTCLQPNERGYVIAFGEFDYRVLTNLKIDSVNFNANPVTLIDEVVLPISYTVSGSQIDIQVVNQSSTAIDVFSYRYIFLDEQGLPLGDELELSDLELQPGEEATISSLMDFRGQSSTLRVIIDFNLLGE